MIIAPSSVYHKTTAMRKSQTILAQAELYSRFGGSHFTSEGIIRMLSEKSSVYVIRDEIGTLIDTKNTPKYQATLKQDLTAIFDGDPIRRTLANSEIHADKPFLNILGATTPGRFFGGVTTLDWADGFLPRWLFVQPKERPNFDLQPSNWSSQLDIQQASLTSELGLMAMTKERYWQIGENAWQMWGEWQKQRMVTAYDYDDEKVLSISSRYCTYALKFALLLSAARDENATCIFDDCMDTGIALAEMYMRNVHHILANNDDRFFGENAQKVFKVIQTNQSCTLREIYRQLNWQKSKVTEIIDRLRESGHIGYFQNGKRNELRCLTDSLSHKGV